MARRGYEEERVVTAKLGNPPREAILIQLREAGAEWRRRKSVNATGGRHSA